jgi:hypothetical protein
MPSIEDLNEIIFSLTQIWGLITFTIYTSELKKRYLGNGKALAVESKKTGSYVHIDLVF